MHTVLQLLAMAAPPAQSGQAAPGPYATVLSFLPFAVIIGVFYFMVMRPQMQRQKQQAATVAKLQKGDKVLLNSGLYAYVHKPADDGAETLTIKLGDALVECQKSAIANKVESTAS